jgi:hypothetical protein
MAFFINKELLKNKHYDQIKFRMLLPWTVPGFIGLFEAA